MGMLLEARLSISISIFYTFSGCCGIVVVLAATIFCFRVLQLYIK